jgi:hypothetical protein
MWAHMFAHRWVRLRSAKCVRLTSHMWQWVRYAAAARGRR